MQRRRFKNTLTFPDRLAKEAERFRQEADTKPPGQGASVAGYCSRIPEAGRTDDQMGDRAQHGEVARCYHEAGADQGNASPVDAQAGNSANREREIASDKDHAGRDTPALPANSITGRKQTWRQRGGHGYHDH